MSRGECQRNIDVKCLYCNQDFKAAKITARFCSRRCIYAYGRAKKLKYNEYTIPCGMCSKDFYRSYSSTFYCSKECKDKARKIAVSKCDKKMYQKYKERKRQYLNKRRKERYWSDEDYRQECLKKARQRRRIRKDNPVVARNTNIRIQARKKILAFSKLDNMEIVNSAV